MDGTKIGTRLRTRGCECGGSADGGSGELIHDKDDAVRNISVLSELGQIVFDRINIKSRIVEEDVVWYFRGIISINKYGAATQREFGGKVLQEFTDVTALISWRNKLHTGIPPGKQATKWL